MRITPLEVHNHQFGTRLRGFDQDEVRAFLALVSEEFELVISETNRLKDQIAEFREQLSEAKSREHNLQKAVGTADRIAQDIKDMARKESEILIKEARLKANKLLEQAQSRTLALEDRTNELKIVRDRFEHRLRSMLEEYLHMLDHVHEDEAQDKIFVLQRPTA